MVASPLSSDCNNNNNNNNDNNTETLPDAVLERVVQLLGTLNNMKEHLNLMIKRYENDPQLLQPLSELVVIVDKSLLRKEQFAVVVDEEEVRKIIKNSPGLTYVSKLVRGFGALAKTKNGSDEWSTPSALTVNHTQKQGKCNPVFCRICCTKFDNWMYLNSFENCSHVYCKECVKKDFAQQIKSGGALTMSCPTRDCQAQVSPMNIYSLCDASTLVDYERLLVLAALNNIHSKAPPGWSKAAPRKNDQYVISAQPNEPFVMSYRPPPPMPKELVKSQASKKALKVGKYAGIGVAVVTLGIPAAIVAAPIYGAYRVGKAVKEKRDVDKIPTRIREIKKEDEVEGEKKEEKKKDEVRELDRKEELEEEHRARVQTRTLGVFSRIRPMRN